MKSVLFGLAFFICSFAANADGSPSKQLVEEYVKQSQAEETISAEIEAYARQLGAEASPEEKARIVEYLNAAMGWNAIKDQYASLVGKIYAEKELKASMAFIKSPIGASITKKNQRFAKEFAVLIAANAQQATKKLQASAPADSDTPPNRAIDLELIRK